jgi:outer membrane protein OmpA-like peptidoglycan-associated protein
LLIAAGVRRPYRHRKEVVEGQHVGKTRIQAKLSLAAVLVLGVALAGCQIPSTYRPLPRQQTAQADAARPGPGARRATPQASSPRRLPGIRPFTREANFGSAEEAALFRELRSTGLDAASDGISIVLILGDDVLFASGSSQLNPKAYTLLKAMASVLKRYGTMQIDVGGYTDTAGSAAFNLRLSRQRATAVADILMSEGVEAPRITTRGFGESFPRVPTRDGVNEPRNRRVEITLVPQTRES